MAEKKIVETVREGKTVYLTKDGKEISESAFAKAMADKDGKAEGKRLKTEVDKEKIVSA